MASPGASLPEVGVPTPNISSARFGSLAISASNRLGGGADPVLHHLLPDLRVEAPLGDQVESVLPGRFEADGVVGVGLAYCGGDGLEHRGRFDLLVVLALLELPLRHAPRANRPHRLLLPSEVGALTLGHARQGIVEQRVEQA
jgi:hypothetical protein